jgi:hypothetical protein
MALEEFFAIFKAAGAIFPRWCALGAPGAHRRRSG